MSEFECEWKPTELDERLYVLATRYHIECESYDRIVCTGPIREDSIMPMNYHEMALINRNARVVRNRLEEEARREGIGRKDLAMAISRWSVKQ